MARSSMVKVRRAVPTRARRASEISLASRPCDLVDEEIIDDFVWLPRPVITERDPMAESQFLEASDYQMDPAETKLTTPYAVSNPEWVVDTDEDFEPHHITFTPQDMPESEVHGFESVVKVFGKVYALAKISYVIFSNFLVDFDDSPADIIVHISHAEALVEADASSVGRLITAVQNLYYALYARLILEIANVDLCIASHISPPRATGHQGFVLPDPGHLLRILLAFKDILDSASVCTELDYAQVKRHQKKLVENMANNVNEKRFFLYDAHGFRRRQLLYMEQKYRDQNHFIENWASQSAIFHMAQPKAIIVAAEKYLAVQPTAMEKDDIEVKDLPFANLNAIDEEQRERAIIHDHRQAALAKLEGRVIGEVRRDAHDFNPMDFMRQQKCTCTPSCGCALQCTHDVERACPCAERLMRCHILKNSSGPDTQNFADRCRNLAKLVFEALCFVRRKAEDQEVEIELRLGLLKFQGEVIKQRRGLAR